MSQGVFDNTGEGRDRAREHKSLSHGVTPWLNPQNFSFPCLPSLGLLRGGKDTKSPLVKSSGVDKGAPYKPGNVTQEIPEEGIAGLDLISWNKLVLLLSSGGIPGERHKPRAAEPSLSWSWS